MAVAKQNINAERIKNEMKHFAKNRTNDFVVNPTKRKCIYNSQSHRFFQLKKLPKNRLIWTLGIQHASRHSWLKRTQMQSNMTKLKLITYSRLFQCREESILQLLALDKEISGRQQLLKRLDGMQNHWCQRIKYRHKDWRTPQSHSLVLIICFWNTRTHSVRKFFFTEIETTYLI